MKKFVIAAIAGGLALASTAFAASTTIEFKRDTGETNTVTLSEGVATLADGTEGTFTWDAEAKKMCFAIGGQDTCVVFAEVNESPAVGDAVRYTAADGAEGTATVIAITE